METACTDRGVRVTYDICYGAEQPHERHYGDLYLPQQSAAAPLALIIHGGGWNAMDKNSFAGVAEFFALQGYAAFAINYRLLRHQAYPACYEDCLAAVSFLAETDHHLFRDLNRGEIVVCGGSAGGHLALMTGLNTQALPVKGIVSIAGPTDLRIQLSKGRFKELNYFGVDEVTEAMKAAASPVTHVQQQSPPLLCTHSTNDELVEIEQAHALLAAYQACGLEAQLFTYVGADKAHGIWPAGSSFPLDGPDGRMHSGLKHLIDPLESAIAAFLKSL